MASADRQLGVSMGAFSTSGSLPLFLVGLRAGDSQAAIWPARCPGRVGNNGGTGFRAGGKQKSCREAWRVHGLCRAFGGQVVGLGAA